MCTFVKGDQLCPLRRHSFMNTDSKDVAVTSWGSRDACVCPGLWLVTELHKSAAGRL